MNIEPLESRTLFTSVLPFTFVQNGSVLNITGADTSVGDQIQLTQNGSIITATDIRSGASISSSGTVTSIVVDLRAGDDYLRERNNDGTKPVLINTTVFGGLGNDTIYGGGVNDNLSGGDGTDKLVGMGGSDGLDGGAGFDTVDYSYETRKIKVTIGYGGAGGGDGVVDILGNGTNVSELDDVQSTVEAVIGGSGNDLLIGSNNPDWLDGGAGNDILSGGAGNDTITGGIGADTVFGGSGSDADFIRDGAIDGSGDTFELAQIDSKAAGSAVNDIGVVATAPTVDALPAFLAAGNIFSNALTLSPPPSSASAPANLDTTFGTNGESLLDLINMHTQGCGTFGDISVSKVLLQPVITSAISGPNASTDRIIVVGTINDNYTNSSDLFVMRLNPDGSLDTTFGDAAYYDVSTSSYVYRGYAITDLAAALGIDGSSNDTAASAVIDPIDGAIVVAATTDVYVGNSDDFAIARYTQSGHLDNFFGTVPDPIGNPSNHSGVSTYDFTQGGGNATVSADQAADIAIQHDSEGFESGYVLAGTAIADSTNVAIARFDLAGNVDTSGFNQVDFADNGVSATGIVEDRAGDFFVSVNRDNGDSTSTPGAFGYYSGGYNFFNEFFTSVPNGVAKDIAVTDTDSGQALAIVGQDYSSHVAFLQEISLSFGEGTSTFDASWSYLPLSTTGGRESIFNSVSFDDSGRAVAVGTVGSTDQFSGDADYLVTRFSPTFGGDGTFNPPNAVVFINMRDPADDGFGNTVNSLDTAESVAIQTDGGIVIAGENVYSNNPGVIGVVRLLGGDNIADATIPNDATIPDLQDQLTWTDPDTGIIHQIPAALFEHALVPTEPAPLVINGTNEDDYISVTATVDGAGHDVFRVYSGNESGWSTVDYERKYVTEIDINTGSGTDVVRINDILYSEVAGDEGNQLAVNITGGANHLQVYVGNTDDSYFDRNISALTDTGSPTLGDVTSTTDDPHTPLADDDGNPIAPDPAQIWTARAVVGTTELDYTQHYVYRDYPDYNYDLFGSLNVTLVQVNEPPVATDDTLADVPAGQDFVIPAADIQSLLLNNDSVGAGETGQTLTLTDVFTSDHITGYDADGHAIAAVDGGTVALNQAGDIVFTPTPGYTGVAKFTYQITDDGRSDDGTGYFAADPKTALGTVSFNIVDTNHAPTDIALDPSTIDENSGANAVVGTLTTTDQDAGDTFTYELYTPAAPTVVTPKTPALNDNSFFSIGSGVNGDKLIANQNFNFETDRTSYTIQVKVTDSGNKSFIKTLTVGVNNVNEKPTANAGGPYTVVQGGSVQLSGSGIDPDANTTLTYAWDVDGDNVFGNSALITGATPNFSPTGVGGTSQTVMLRVSDGVLTDTTTATVNITAPVVGQKLYGTIFDSKGSAGNTPDKAFDGNPNTFFANASSPMVEMDLGAAKTITKITYTPRNSFGSKMVGGMFQISNDSTFRTGVTTLYTITAAPATGSVTTVNISSSVTGRYFRYYAPGTDGSVAEIGVFGSPGGGADHVAPSAPGAPTLTGHTYTSVSLAWNPSYDYFGVDHYDIYRGSTKIGTTSNLFFTDTGAVGGPLKAGTAYTYTIKAFDAAGNSATSAAASLKTLADTVKPTQPTNLHVVNGSLTKTSVTIAWDTSSDDIAVVGYYIFRNGTKVGTTSSLSFADSGLKTKTKYTYTVQAFDSAGNVSLLSAALVVTTL